MNLDDCTPEPLEPIPPVRPFRPQVLQPSVLEDIPDDTSETLDDILDDNAREPFSEPEFFPFPDEKFFLLYCYAHGIMRPKVTRTFNFLLIIMSRLQNFMPFKIFQ